MVVLTALAPSCYETDIIDGSVGSFSTSSILSVVYMISQNITSAHIPDLTN